MSSEKPSIKERARTIEKTIMTERATAVEKPIIQERGRGASPLSFFIPFYPLPLIDAVVDERLILVYKGVNKMKEILEILGYICLGGGGIAFATMYLVPAIKRRKSSGKGKASQRRGETQ